MADWFLGLLVGAFVGVAFAILVPKAFRLYSLLQANYERGFQHGRYAARSESGKAQDILASCRHTPPGVCDTCAALARGVLSKVMREI